MNIEPLTLSSKEVYVLTGIFDHETMIGIENPFENWLEEEIDKELDIMYDHWREKELLIIKEDEVFCEQQLVEYFSICLTTGFVIEVQINKNDIKEKNVFYFTDKKVIHNRITDVNGEKQCIFRECGIPEVAWQFIYQALQSKNTFPHSNYTFKLPCAVYEKDFLNQSEKDLSELFGYYSDDDVKELVNIICDREELNTIKTHYYIKDAWYTDSIQYMYSQNQYWLIQKILDRGEKQTNVICLDIFAIIEEIKKMVLYLKSIGGESK
ncbi:MULTISPECIES: hypothetical protein [Bacillus cereus group]|uniref:Uncharacterized protein n=1 Tax=Bacillus thuringiensis TaxID=1428 RepID=A0A1C4B4Z5_BACTU|nr:MULTISPECIES: hypothetical protein [Bacillus cereus group]MCU5331003.1 hypothetical protein [Bacillus wiedmannii]MED3023418.1 hypothetical protein [Bacillus wiedmannii]OTX96645.1 hypothetical protein BK729_17650 [Bacillus thuringiensis serovar wratislaviensis]OUB57398.1 hypothetical protein BK743_15680 [Bacillus thuringiensis serovar sylvestriensis]SCC01930.1 Uncharacterized protein BTT61001_01099 [Bacillus thuringiensis]